MKPAAKKSERKLTDEQNAAWVGFRDWWCKVAYPARMGIPYAFEAAAGRNAGALKIILEAVKYDLAAAKAVALAYLNANDGDRRYQYRPLFGISENITNWVHAAHGARPVNGAPNGQQLRNGHGHDSRAGEYQQPHRQLPTLNGRATGG